MPYSAAHKLQTRARITEAARVLFNRHGFAGVSIDMVMEAAGLTRGGFYNHFDSKEALYQAAVASFLMGRGAQWRADAGVDVADVSAETTRQMVDSYLSAKHLDDVDGQCPMIALPSDVARAAPEVRESYQHLLTAMISLFENDLVQRDTQGFTAADARCRAQAMAALCIGGMVIARTLPDAAVADEVREAALTFVHELGGTSERQAKAN